MRFCGFQFHHACRTGKPFGFFMSARDGLRPERLSPFRTPGLTRLARGSNRFSVALLLTNPLISTTYAERENRSVFHVVKGWATPQKAFAFPNPEADAIGSRQQSLFRRIAPYESPYLHHACRTGKPFGFFMSSRDGLRPERLSRLSFVFVVLFVAGA